jgi:hypothetical protein
MTYTFNDQFGRVWEVTILEYDPAPNATKYFCSVKAETPREGFKFFAAFENADSALSKAEEFANLLPPYS